MLHEEIFGSGAEVIERVGGTCAANSGEGCENFSATEGSATDGSRREKL